MREYVKDIFTDPYFDYIDIKSKGIKRLMIVLHIVVPLLSYGILRQYDAGILAWGTPFFITYTTKAVTWLKNEFDKNRTS